MPEMSDPPRVASRHLLTLELYQGKLKGEPTVSVLLSLPGRENMLMYHWGQYPSALRPHELEDMTARLEQIVTTSLLLAGGIQEVLPFD